MRFLVRAVLVCFFAFGRVVHLSFVSPIFFCCGTPRGSICLFNLLVATFDVYWQTFPGYIWVPSLVVWIFESVI